METENLDKNIANIFDKQNKYIIPLYQRNFSWRREQIEQLLQDIYSAFKNEQKHYYIGSLVVLKRSNGDFEVIDGQQRLTVLSLITKILKLNDEPRLFYDSRPEFEEFLADFYKSKDGSCNIDYPQTAHLRNAIRYIKEIDLDAERTNAIEFNKDTDLNTERISVTINNTSKEFSNYFKNNVILVRVEIPQDTDVASYFEIMNNRGVQLQKHEIVKAFLMNKLKTISNIEFSKIWNACSQMDTPIQKLFKTNDRPKYFGENYDQFIFTMFDAPKDTNENPPKDTEEKNKTLDEILESEFLNSQNDKNEEDTDSDVEGDKAEVNYKSIIDFPNFLMHIFKLLFPDVDIPLNEKYLIDTYKKVGNRLNAEDFLKKLFFCRTIFDSYMVKTTSDNNSEDGERWTLRKPKKNNNKALEYVNTFEEKGHQNKIVKALTMLQVTFRSKIYKTWLYKTLEWFNEQVQGCAEFKNIRYDDYLMHLNKFIIEYYEERFNEYKSVDENTPLTKDNSYSQGCNTPHFLFNFIDYLYWVDSKKTKPLFQHELKDFDFKYWNSIEHHLAKQFAIDDGRVNYENYIDNLGNLCLISKGSNSRLSDRSIEEKITRMKDVNMGANRQIIYAKSKNNDGKYSWDENKIKDHYKELLVLLDKRKDILEIHPCKPTSQATDI